MNTRVLELIKNPKTITESDLNILESESEKMPYAQSIRALYLYGINLYQSENYKENLSKTAAYTTDKKILYQFINSQKIIQKEPASIRKTEELSVENQTINKKTSADNIIEKVSENAAEVESASVILNKFDIDRIIESEDAQNSEYIIVEGEKNRLLYDGEENFLEEKSSEIDLEATRESGVITVKDDLEIKENLISNDDNRSEATISEHTNTEEVLNITDEKISESPVDKQVQDEDSSGNISFNGIEDFLPQVKFSVPKNHLDHLNPPIKEFKNVESVTGEKPVFKTEYKEPLVAEIPENEIDNHQISFENTQYFEVSKAIDTEKTAEIIVNKEEEESKNQINFENTPALEVSKPEETVIETQIQETENIVIEQVDIPEQPVSEWKPMSFAANTPDALIGRTQEIKKSEEKTTVEKIQKPEAKEEIIIEEKPAVETKSEMQETERPVMNVSFFGNEVSRIEEQEKETETISEKTEASQIPDSNVGTFINTWQSWLKIDRPKSSEPVEKTIVVKEKIIDEFIEKNPKISQLKDEVSFIVKEKKDDISHLMTETLARLYVEQKLYSKAIKAYKILSEKHPHKAEYFLGKVEEVKEIRKS